LIETEIRIEKSCRSAHPMSLMGLKCLKKDREALLAFLRGLDQLEHHGKRRPVGEVSLRADGAVADGGEGTLDGVRRPEVLPVLGREVVRKAGASSMATSGRHQDLAIARQGADST
jgi:hypothetical protein